MSTLKVTNIQDTSGGNSLTTAQLYSGAAKAWVNFDGTGSIGANQTIKASFNVSSVSKSATGTYTVNFTTAFSDANYSATYAGDATASPSDSANILRIDTLSTTSVNFRIGGLNASAYFVGYYDSPRVCMSFFR